MTSELTSSKYFELIVNWFLNLLVRNVIEREIEKEKVQMKPSQVFKRTQATLNQYLNLMDTTSLCIQGPCNILFISYVQVPDIQWTVVTLRVIIMLCKELQFTQLNELR